MKATADLSREELEELLSIEKERTGYLSQYFGQLIDSMTEGFLITDEELFIEETNEAARKLFCRAQGNLEGMPLSSLIPLEQLPSYTSLEDLDKIDGYHGEVSTEHSVEEGLRTLHVSLSVVRHSSGEIQGLLCIAKDVSEKKKLEDNLHQARKLEAVGQLAAGVAHEINTPIQYVRDNMLFLKEELTSINELLKKTTELVETDYTTEEIRDRMNEILQYSKDIELDYLLSEIPKAVSQTLEGADSVAKIVNSMKEFSHPGGEEQVAVNINSAVETVATVSRNEWKYVANLEMKLDPSHPSSICYPGEMNQVLVNVLINAAHAIQEKGTEEKGTITISTKDGEDSVLISISDTGCGMPESTQKRIFDPFFTTKDVGKGTGQGLALAHSTVVERHGGRIWCESEEGTGTIFYIELPK